MVIIKYHIIVAYHVYIKQYIIHNSKHICIKWSKILFTSTTFQDHLENSAMGNWRYKYLEIDLYLLLYNKKDGIIVQDKETNLA